MKKLILAMAVIAFSAANVNAQDAAKKTKVSIAANAGIPTTTGYNFAVGGDIQADFSVASTTAITVSAGYENFSGKVVGIKFNSGLIPVLAGAKFGFSDKFYGHAQLGYGVGTKSGQKGAFAYAPSIGYNFASNFDASVKYLAFSYSGATLGSVNLRLAYNF